MSATSLLIVDEKLENWLSSCNVVKPSALDRHHEHRDACLVMLVCGSRAMGTYVGGVTGIALVQASTHHPVSQARVMSRNYQGVPWGFTGTSCHKPYCFEAAICVIESEAEGENRRRCAELVSNTKPCGSRLIQGCWPNVLLPLLQKLSSQVTSSVALDRSSLLAPKRLLMPPPGVGHRPPPAALKPPGTWSLQRHCGTGGAEGWTPPMLSPTSSACDKKHGLHRQRGSWQLWFRSYPV